MTSDQPEIHTRSIIVDGHCDTPFRLHLTGLKFADISPTAHVDIEKLEASGISASFFVSYIPGHYAGRGARRFALHMIDIIDATIAQHPDRLVKTVDTKTIRDAKARGRVAILIGVEGGHAIENSLDTLVELYDRGARYMTLTHTNTNDWADSSGDEPRHGGLTTFGREVVTTMNDLGMLVDVSHVADSTFYHVLETSRVPVIASHSSCRAIAPHPRNLSDTMLRDLASVKGVCMINFFSAFVEPKAAEILMSSKRPDVPRTAREPDDASDGVLYESWFASLNCPSGTIDTVVDHLAHACSVAGAESVGIGTDYDGCSLVPKGLDNASKLPRLTERMLERGFRENEIEGILGKNFLRVFEAVESASPLPRGAYALT